MAWIFSAAFIQRYTLCSKDRSVSSANLRCLQEQVVAYWPDNCWVGEQSVPWNTSHTPQLYLWRGKTTAALNLSRYGTTLRLSKDFRGEELLTSFREASPAPRLVQRGKVKGSKKATPVGSGLKWRESYLKYDPSTSSWKTHRSLWGEDSTLSSPTLPRWGMLRRGVVLEPTMSERRINDIVSGWLGDGKTVVSWATPLVPNGGRGITHAELRGKTAYTKRGKKVQVSLDNQVKLEAAGVRKRGEKMYPTPTCSDSSNAPNSGGNVKRWGGVNGLGAKASTGVWDGTPADDTVCLWPTELATDSKNNGGPSQHRRHSPQLSTVVGSAWPTPQSRDYKGSSGRSLKGTETDLPTAVNKANWPTPRSCSAMAAVITEDAESVAKAGGRFPNLETVMAQRAPNAAGGALNPVWVEWLMGWPMGWTDLRPQHKHYLHWEYTAAQGWWLQDPANRQYRPISRLTTKRQHRMPRLKAIGNGQVPLCAAMAWLLLRSEVDRVLDR